MTVFTLAGISSSSATSSAKEPANNWSPPDRLKALDEANERVSESLGDALAKTGAYIIKGFAEKVIDESLDLLFGREEEEVDGPDPNATYPYPEKTKYLEFITPRNQRYFAIVGKREFYQTNVDEYIEQIYLTDEIRGQIRQQSAKRLSSELALLKKLRETPDELEEDLKEVAEEISRLHGVAGTPERREQIIWEQMLFSFYDEYAERAYGELLWVKIILDHTDDMVPTHKFWAELEIDDEINALESARRIRFMSRGMSHSEANQAMVDEIRNLFFPFADYKDREVIAFWRKKMIDEVVMNKARTHARGMMSALAQQELEEEDGEYVRASQHAELYIESGMPLFDEMMASSEPVTLGRYQAFMKEHPELQVFVRDATALFQAEERINIFIPPLGAYGPSWAEQEQKKKRKRQYSMLIKDRLWPISVDGGPTILGWFMNDFIIEVMEMIDCNDGEEALKQELAQTAYQIQFGGSVGAREKLAQLQLVLESLQYSPIAVDPQGLPGLLEPYVKKLLSETHWNLYGSNYDQLDDAEVPMWNVVGGTASEIASMMIDEIDDENPMKPLIGISLEITVWAITFVLEKESHGMAIAIWSDIEKNFTELRDAAGRRLRNDTDDSGLYLTKPMEEVRAILAEKYPGEITDPAKEAKMRRNGWRPPAPPLRILPPEGGYKPKVIPPIRKGFAFASKDRTTSSVLKKLFKGADIRNSDALVGRVGFESEINPDGMKLEVQAIDHYYPPEPAPKSEIAPSVYRNQHIPADEWPYAPKPSEGKLKTEARFMVARKRRAAEILSPYRLLLTLPSNSGEPESPESMESPDSENSADATDTGTEYSPWDASMFEDTYQDYLDYMLQNRFISGM